MKRILFFSLLISCTLRLFAVPAYPDKVRFTQPDKRTQLDIFLKGDEKVHWAETEDGYTLVHAEDGTLVYATLDLHGDMQPSSLMATDKESRSLQVLQFLATTPCHLRYSEGQVKQMTAIWNDMSKMKREAKTMTNVTGEKRFLVILFAFNDMAFTHSKVEFKHLFNQVNYSEHNAYGSVHDYYYDVSQGQFSLTVDVVGPYRGSQDHEYYGDDSGYQDFAEEAVEFASHDVDFSDYDNDGDGYIDGLHIIFAGHGEEAGAGSDCIWSHKWNIFSSPVYNNTVVNVYSCSPECSGSNGTSLTAIGVICHELGHVFGAPDYYDTDYAGSGGEYPGLGTYDIMSSGSWNRGGRCPAHHNPYTKIYVYHWATLDTLDEPQTVLMHRAESEQGEFHRINTSTPGDFFILENRQKEKWDLALPSQGLVVYHVHPHASGANVSNARHPQQLYILANTGEAYPNSQPSSYGYLTDDGAVYPRKNFQLDSLTDFSIPAFRPWSQQENHTPLTHIDLCQEDSTVAFCFKGSTPKPFGFDGEGVSDNTVALRWQRYGRYSYVVVRSTSALPTSLPSGIYQEGDVVPNSDAVVCYAGSRGKKEIANLQPGTQYHFALFMMLRDSSYVAPLYCDVTTLSCQASEWEQETFEEAEASTLPACWNGPLSQAIEAGYTSGWQVVSSEMEPMNLSVANNALMGYATGEPIMLEMPPMGVDSSLNKVFQFDMMERLDSGVVEVLYRPNISSEWKTIDSLLVGDQPDKWYTYFVDLPAVTDYSRLAFRLSTAAASQIFIDNIRISSGYLLNATSDENGSIAPKGYQVVQLGDSIHFKMFRHPGYKLKKLWVDGKSMTFSTEEGYYAYTLKVKGSHEVRAEFQEDLAIAECDNATLLVYPNPTQGDVHVELPSMTDLQLFDMQGRLIWSARNVTDLVTIPMQALPRGVYLLRSAQGVKKIVKK